MVECPRRAPVGLPSHVGTSYPTGARHCFEQSVQTYPPVPLPVPSGRVVERVGLANGQRTMGSSSKGYGTKLSYHYPTLDTIHTPSHKPLAGQRGIRPKRICLTEQAQPIFLCRFWVMRSNFAPFQSCPKVRARETTPCNPISTPNCKCRRIKKFEWLFSCTVLRANANKSRARSIKREISARP